MLTLAKAETLILNMNTLENSKGLSKSAKAPVSMIQSDPQHNHGERKASIIPDYPRRKQHNSKKSDEKRRNQGRDSSLSDESQLHKRESSNETYQDYSSVKISDIYNDAPMIVSDAPFSIKLHKILSDPDYSSVISWLPHGRSWRVLQPKVFEEKIIPLFFRHTRISSFMRQVNGWGFRRISRGIDINSYYHELFLRGMPHLCLTMRRLKKSQIKKNHDPNYVPDFYNLNDLSVSEDNNKSIQEKNATREFSQTPESPSNDSSSSSLEGSLVSTSALEAAPVLHQPNAHLPSVGRMNQMVGAHDINRPSELQILRLQQEIIGERLYQVQNTLVMPHSLRNPLSILGTAPSYPVPTMNNTEILREALAQSQIQNQALRARLFVSMDNGQLPYRNENANIFTPNQLFPRFM